VWGLECVGEGRVGVEMDVRVNLPHEMNFRALFGANVVTQPSKFGGNEPLVLYRAGPGASQQEELGVRTGSWTGPPRGKRAPRVGISSPVFGVRAYLGFGIRVAVPHGKLLEKMRPDRQRDAQLVREHLRGNRQNGRL